MEDEAKQKALKYLDDHGGETADGIDLKQYTAQDPAVQEYSGIDEIPQDTKEFMESVGLEVTDTERGVYLQTDNNNNLCVNNARDVVLLPIKEALKIYDGTDGKLNLKDYLWKAVAPDKDRYTVETATREITEGYFIYAPKGARTTFPMQSCLFINIPGLKQVVHNVIIAEEDAHLDIITGCTVHRGAKKAMHIGVSEFFGKKNSRISFTMVHNWQDTTGVRPRTGIILEENAQFSNFYVVMSAVENLQTNPVINLNGANSSYYGQTLIYGKGASKFDTGTTAFLRGEGSSAEIISRVIAVDEAHIIARGKIVGDARNSSGHIDCSALLLSNKARVDSIPEIQAWNPEVSLTHEASVGKIAPDHIEYLMSRGLSEEEATDLIIRGFLDADTSSLPPKLAEETKKMIALAANSEMG